jgi:H+/Cl- antiporter ClcA
MLINNSIIIGSLFAIVVWSSEFRTINGRLTLSGLGIEFGSGYALLAPMMLATFIAYAVSGQNNSIFKSQVMARSDSPAHNNSNNNNKEEN